MKPTTEEHEAIEAMAAEWLTKRDRRFTAEEAVAFARWHRADPRHGAAVAELELVWNALDDLSAAPSQQRAGDAVAASPAPLVTMSPTAEPKRRRAAVAAWWPAWGIAAALVIAAATWWSRSPAENVEPAVVRFETDIGKQRTVALADGSEVQLNTDTAINVALGRRERAVTLERGEALFRVARDEARPFTVAIDRAEVRVLGTTFAVRRREADSVVLVTEGVVQFGVVGRPGARLHAGQQATLAQRGSDVPRVETLSAEAVKRRLAWKDGWLEFENTPLSEVAAEFNRYHRSQLAVTDAAAATPIGGVFKIENLEGLLRFLESSVDVNVERRTPEKIVLGSRL